MQFRSNTNAISETILKRRKIPSIERREKNPLERSQPIEWKKSSLRIASTLESSNNICILRIRLILEIPLHPSYFTFPSNISLSSCSAKIYHFSTSHGQTWNVPVITISEGGNDFNNVSRDNRTTIWIWSSWQDFFHDAPSTMTRGLARMKLRKLGYVTRTDQIVLLDHSSPTRSPISFLYSDFISLIEPRVKPKIHLFKTCIEHLYARSRIKFSASVDLSSANHTRTHYVFRIFRFHVESSSLIRWLSSQSRIYFRFEWFRKTRQRSIVRRRALRLFARIPIRGFAFSKRTPINENIWSIRKFSIISKD